MAAPRTHDQFRKNFPKLSGEEQVVESDFHDRLISLLPSLRARARALSRDRATAEDLLHDTVCSALAARASFTPGTNMGAWLHRILRNRFISDLRARRDSTPIEDVAAEKLAVNATHEDRVAIRELDRAIGRLPVDQRTALLMVTLDGMSYEEIADATGAAVGTAKSRVFRARRQLQAWLMGEPASPPRNSLKSPAAVAHVSRNNI